VSQTTAKRLILIIFAMLLLPAVVMAATTWTDPDGYFRIELYDVDGTPGSGGNVTYKYAVTDLAGTSTNALSHWTLGIESCVDNIVKPLDGALYTTPIEPAVCGTGDVYEPCTSATYLVEFGPDGQVPGVNGIKFLDPDVQLGNGETHLFFITVSGVTATGENPVVVKSGSTSLTGMIDGPVCVPSAVSFSNTSVASSGNTAFVAIAALTMLMGVATVGVWRKHEK
jgi:hypothetical protein